MRSKTPSRFRDDSGSAVLEMAVAFPIFATLSFGFINFALAMFGLCNVTFATHSALRYASLHSTASYTPTTTQAINSIVQPLVYRFPSNTETTTVTYGSGGNVIGQTVTITSRITYNIGLYGYSYNGLALTVVQAGVVTM